MGNRKSQFAVTRLQFHVAESSNFSNASSSVQSSSFLFCQNIIQYKNTCRNCKVAREPRRNQKAYETWAPQWQRNKEKENEIRGNRNKTETELSYEFSNKIKKLILDWNRKLSYVSTAERNIKSIWTTRSLLRRPCCFSSSRNAPLSLPKKQE